MELPQEFLIRHMSVEVYEKNFPHDFTKGELLELFTKYTQEQNDVNQQRDLLTKFCKWVGDNTPSYSVLPIKKLVDSYLKNQ